MSKDHKDGAAESTVAAPTDLRNISMTLSKALRKPATTFAVSGGIFVLMMLLTLLFEGLSATGRLVVATTAIGGALALFLASSRSFFQFRLSGSTVVMVIGFAGIAAGVGLGTFLFLGVALLAAGSGLVFALVQLIRFRSLQSSSRQLPTCSS